MNITSKNSLFGILFYSIAAIMVVSGIALNFPGTVRTGTLLIALSMAVAGGTAVRLGHLKKW